MQAISLTKTLAFTPCEFCHSNLHPVFQATGHENGVGRPRAVKMCVICLRSAYQQVMSLTNAKDTGKVPQ
jgi:hypothetical protein